MYIIRDKLHLKLNTCTATKIKRITNLLVWKAKRASVEPRDSRDDAKNEAMERVDKNKSPSVKDRSSTKK